MKEGPDNVLRGELGSILALHFALYAMQKGTCERLMLLEKTEIADFGGAVLSGNMEPYGMVRMSSAIAAKLNVSRQAPPLASLALHIERCLYTLDYIHGSSARSKGIQGVPHPRRHGWRCDGGIVIPLVHLGLVSISRTISHAL